MDDLEVSPGGDYCIRYVFQHSPCTFCDAEMPGAY